MKQLILLSTLILIRLSSYSQNDNVFNYTDSLFEKGAIHYLDLRFDFNGGFVIKDSIALEELKQLGKFINSHPKFRFDIEHHTDSRGSKEFLLRHSRFRAERLSNLLIYKYSVDSSQIRPIGYGKSKPIISNAYQKQMHLEFKDANTAEGVHFVNRRSIIRIREILE